MSEWPERGGSPAVEVHTQLTDDQQLETLRMRCSMQRGSIVTAAAVINSMSWHAAGKQGASQSTATVHSAWHVRVEFVQSPWTVTGSLLRKEETLAVRLASAAAAGAAAANATTASTASSADTRAMARRTSLQGSFSD